ncbi:hypothetical protein [Roseivivax sp. CAU 1753]
MPDTKTPAQADEALRILEDAFAYYELPTRRRTTANGQNDAQKADSAKRNA